MKRKIFIIVFFLISFLSFFNLSVYAASEGGSQATEGGSTANEGGSTVKGSAVPLDDPLSLPGNTTEGKAAELFARLIKTMLAVVGSLAFLVFIIGGVTWLTSSGNPERVKAGKDMFLYAVLGLAIVFSSYAILSFVFRALVA